jgi:hypoxanthine phosphoribosyltransferase
VSFGYDERYSPSEIARRVQEVAQRITTDYPDESPITLIAVLKGAGIFVADLARALPRPVRIEYIDVMRGKDDDEIVDFHFTTRFERKDADLIVLKDVVRSGVIETYLLNQLREEGPRSIRLASMVDRPQERKSSLVTDYVLFPSEEGMLVGYGMEYQGEGGNFPFIAQVRADETSPLENTGRIRFSKDTKG